MLKQILEQYKIVFNEDGTVKNCGREECIKLIEILNGTFVDKVFGNEKTGFMNISNIHEAISSIIKNPSEELMKQYSVVFDENNVVKNCGRKECMKLIEMMNKEYPNISFGNLKTGFMNTENIILIIKK